MDETLKQIHEALAKNLLNKIKKGKATAAELAVARQFLRDNGINCDGERNPTTRNIADSLPFQDPDLRIAE